MGYIYLSLNEIVLLLFNYKTLLNGLLYKISLEGFI